MVESAALAGAEWVARVAAAGRGGKVVTAPRGRLPAPFNTDHGLVTDSGRTRAELGHGEVAAPGEALREAVARERENLPARPTDYGAGDAVLAELGL